MSTVVHEMLPAHNDVTHEITSAAENPRIEDELMGTRCERNVVEIEGDEVGALSRLDSTGLDSERLCAAERGPRIKLVENRAPLMHEPLSVFEQT